MPSKSQPGSVPKSEAPRVSGSGEPPHPLLPTPGKRTARGLLLTKAVRDRIPKGQLSNQKIHYFPIGGITSFRIKMKPNCKMPTRDRSTVFLGIIHFPDMSSSGTDFPTFCHQALSNHLLLNVSSSTQPQLQAVRWEPSLSKADTALSSFLKPRQELRTPLPACH